MYIAIVSPFMFCLFSCICMCSSAHELSSAPTLSPVRSTSAQPTSQPTQYFEAPSIPTLAKETSTIAFSDSDHDHGLIQHKDADHYDGVSRADNINEELEEETRTAINGATYIFYTFLAMLVCVFIAYFCKKYVPIVAAALSSIVTRRQHLVYEYSNVLVRPVGKTDNMIARYQPVLTTDDHDLDDMFNQRDTELN